MSKWNRRSGGSGNLVAASGAGFSHTGDTIETAVVTVPFLANSLTIGDIIRVRWFVKIDLTGGGAPSVRSRLGNNATLTANTALVDIGSSSAVINAREFDICITSATTATLFALGDTDAIGSTTAAAREVTTNFDITTDMNLYLNALLSNAANVLDYASYSVEVIKAK